MRARVLAVLALAFAIIGLGASAASLVDYVGNAPTFCTEGGCATVRQSVWARPLGIPLPVIGIGYFAAMLALAFIARPRLRIALAALGGGGALGLIALQAFVIDAWCKLCLVADPAGIGHALAVIAGATTIPRRWKHGATVVAALATVVLALGAWTTEKPREVSKTIPESVAREQRPGVVTIVEFVDFECPFCRALDKKLTDALGRAQQRVRIVRKMVPLPSHPHSVPAAMAWVAADSLGHGDAMAKGLMTTPTDELTPAGCEQIAVRVGCDVAAYRAAFASADTRTRIERDMADAEAADLAGFPTIFIGTQRFEGANHTTETLLAAIEHAAR